MNNQKNREFEIIQNAVEVFKRETGLTIIQQQPNHQKFGPFGDAVLQIGEANNTVEYNVEIKTNLNDVTVGRLAHDLTDATGNNLVVTRYVPPTLAKKNENVEHSIH